MSKANSAQFAKANSYPHLVPLTRGMLFRNVETLKQYLKKGNRVCVSGSLKQKRWEKEGKHQSRVAIRIRELMFLTPKEKGEQPDSVTGEVPDTHDTEFESENWG